MKKEERRVRFKNFDMLAALFRRTNLNAVLKSVDKEEKKKIFRKERVTARYLPQLKMLLKGREEGFGREKKPCDCSVLYREMPEQIMTEASQGNFDSFENYLREIIYFASRNGHRVITLDREYFSLFMKEDNIEKFLKDILKKKPIKEEMKKQKIKIFVF